MEKFYDREPDYIYVDTWQLEWGTKFARVIYASFKIIYASIWFYFIPFSCLYLSYVIPYAYGPGEDRYSKIASGASLFI